jgi:hypothetical protein
MSFRKPSEASRRSLRPVVSFVFLAAVALFLALSGLRPTGAEAPVRRPLPLPPAEPPVVASAAVSAKTEMDEPPDASSQVNGKWYGLCPKNTTRTVEDLRRIIQSDPLLDRYYADFDWDRARTGRLSQPESVHMAYRKNDVIRYTKRQVQIPQKEHYVTDGKRRIKTSCCNDFIAALPPSPAGEAAEPPVIVAAPAAPETHSEPAPPSKPSAPVAVSKVQPPTVYAAAPPPVFYSPPGEGGGGGGGDRPGKKGKPSPPGPTPVPEPATLLLFGSGLAGLGLAWRIWQKKRN